MNVQRLEGKEEIPPRAPYSRKTKVMKKRYEEILERKRKGEKIGGNSKILREYKEVVEKLGERDMEMLVGMGLGDMNIKKLKTGTRLRWEYSEKSEEYVNHIRERLKYYIISEPYIVERKGIRTWRMQTLGLEQLNRIGDMFINEEGKKRIKKGLG